MTAVVVDALTKKYGRERVVDELSFQVEGGQILGLVGQNGAGKTTTLQMLAGIVRPTSGKVCIADRDLATHPIEAKRSLGYAPDNPKLFPGLTVWEHLAFTAAAYSISDFHSEAESLLEYFQLNEKRDSVASTLSRGMRQKVSVACSYLHHPKVILYDEPITGLDPPGIRILTDSIRSRAAAGAAVIVSSHLLGVVEDLCTHLLLMNRGSLIASGRLEDVLASFSKGDGESGLEEIFFAITHEDARD